ncbi:squalene monooxygenase [Chloropicon primus]|uniref:Squalene monooxygenase n=2 Tax=Chloropicon primus TaxID=1764295 RepID=A0A5B8MQ66_9CHLO|nr:squalene monooxygenase [Chloropicon primus]UPR02062.1 squalene monooxygenase [Chloropicon primus]|eukprot:QDZ22838.1 squalene monooxygenase [Chloropicon primus]
MAAAAADNNKMKMKKKLAGRSFHNGRFVRRLREACGEVGEERLRLVEGTVRGFVDERGEPWEDDRGDRGGNNNNKNPICGVTYRPKGGEEDQGELVTVRAHLTIVCDGMYSSLRKNLVKDPKIELPSFFVGLLLKDEGKDRILPFPNHGHVVLADPSPILFYPISSTETRCLIDIKAKKLPRVSTGELAKYLTERVAPQVPDQLREPFLAAVKEGRVRSMQNKLMPAEVFTCDGALMLGDAFNMRHPLTGGGMTVALHDSKLLCDMLSHLKSFEHKRSTTLATKAFHTERKPWAATINTLANALYKVFCRTGEEWNEEMQSACFDYLSLGGMYSQGPISLLGGLNPRPFVLVAHFFMVALYGIGRLLKPFPTPKGLLIGCQLLMGAIAIILPIIKAEGIVRVFAPFLIGETRKGFGARQRTTAAAPSLDKKKKTR